MLLSLSQNLRAFVSQRLVPTLDGKRCAAVEVLLGTKTIQELVLKARLEDIKEIMEKSENLGMQTFDGALFHLYRSKRISYDETIANADSPNNLRLRIKLAESGSGKDEPVAEPVVEEAEASKGFGELKLEVIQEEEENTDPFAPRS